MRRKPVNAGAMGVLLWALMAPGAHAQDAAALKRENEQLRAQLADAQSKCPGPGVGAPSPGEQRVGELGFSVSSIRTTNDDGRMRVAVTMRIRNLGTEPVALNYVDRSLSLVDELGYRYDIRTQVAGISTAYGNSVGVDDVILPGNDLPVTFEMYRWAENRGETIGQRFDINATFGQFQDLGQGRVRRVRNYAVAFTGIPASRGLPTATESMREPQQAIRGALRSLLGQ